MELLFVLYEQLLYFCTIKPHLVRESPQIDMVPFLFTQFQLRAADAADRCQNWHFTECHIMSGCGIDPISFIRGYRGSVAFILLHGINGYIQFCLGAYIQLIK